MTSLSKCYPAVPESIGRARHAIEQYARACGAAPDIAARVALAVSEACTNVVLHAYIDRPRPGELRLSAEHERSAREIHVTVEDDGRGMMPRIDSPGLGMGMPIIGQISSVYEVHTAISGGTTLSMRFAVEAHRPAAQASRS